MTQSSGTFVSATAAFPFFAEISRYFAPGWCAAVIGSGAVALLPPHSLAGRRPWLLRRLRFREAALGHPVLVSLHLAWTMRVNDGRLSVGLDLAHSE